MIESIVSVRWKLVGIGFAGFVKLANLAIGEDSSIDCKFIDFTAEIAEHFAVIVISWIPVADHGFADHDWA